MKQQDGKLMRKMQAVVSILLLQVNLAFASKPAHATSDVAYARLNAGATRGRNIAGDARGSSACCERRGGQRRRCADAYTGAAGSAGTATGAAAICSAATVQRADSPIA